MSSKIKSGMDALKYINILNSFPISQEMHMEILRCLKEDDMEGLIKIIGTLVEGYNRAQHCKVVTKTLYEKIYELTQEVKELENKIDILEL